MGGEGGSARRGEKGPVSGQRFLHPACASIGSVYILTCTRGRFAGKGGEWSRKCSLVEPRNILLSGQIAFVSMWGFI